MKFDTTFIALVPSILSLSADAYAPSLLVSRSSRAFVTNRIPKTTSGSSRLFSQWDEEEEEETTVLSTPSFEEAGKQIGDEDDQAAMDEMGEFDATSTVSTFFAHFVCPAAMVWQLPLAHNPVKDHFFYEACHKRERSNLAASFRGIDYT
jgi:hypothetical protein